VVPSRVLGEFEIDLIESGGQRFVLPIALVVEPSKKKEERLDPHVPQPTAAARPSRPEAADPRTWSVSPGVRCRRWVSGGPGSWWRGALHVNLPAWRLFPGTVRPAVPRLWDRQPYGVLLALLQRRRRNHPRALHGNWRRCWHSTRSSTWFAGGIPTFRTRQESRCTSEGVYREDRGGPTMTWKGPSS